MLRADMRYWARAAAERTDAQAKEAFVHDRRHRSRAMIDGLGPPAAPYPAGARAVTAITSAPGGTPGRR